MLDPGGVALGVELRVSRQRQAQNSEQRNAGAMGAADPAWAVKEDTTSATSLQCCLLPLSSTLAHSILSACNTQLKGLHLWEAFPDLPRDSCHVDTCIRVSNNTYHTI